jgi:hypothetical protein
MRPRAHQIGTFPPRSATLARFFRAVRYGTGVARNTATRVSKVFGSWKKAVKAS